MFCVRPHRTVAAIGAVLLTTFALAACAGGDGSSDSAASGPQAGLTEESGGRAADSSGDDSGSSAGSPGKGASGSNADPVTAANLAANQESLARRASIALKVTNIGQAV